MVGYGDPREIDFFSFFVNAIQSVRPNFTGPPMDPPPLPFQLQDPERLRSELAAAGLKDIQVVTITEATGFRSGKELWDWIVYSNPIVDMVLGELDLGNDEKDAALQAMEQLVRDAPEAATRQRCPIRSISASASSEQKNPLEMTTHRYLDRISAIGIIQGEQIRRASSPLR